jgi:hypothetical protein
VSGLAGRIVQPGSHTAFSSVAELLGHHANIHPIAELNRLASQMAPASCSRLGVQQPERLLSSPRC